MWSSTGKIFCYNVSEDLGHIFDLSFLESSFFFFSPEGCIKLTPFVSGMFLLSTFLATQAMALQEKLRGL